MPGSLNILITLFQRQEIGQLVEEMMLVGYIANLQDNRTCQPFPPRYTVIRERDTVAPEYQLRHRI
jgi:hypothetical protein